LGFNWNKDPKRADESRKGDRVILFLDTFGASGGVGRCTRELLKAFTQSGTDVLCCGRSHVVESFKPIIAEDGRIRFHNLDRPLYDPRVLSVRFCSHFFGQSATASDALLGAVHAKIGKTDESHTKSRILVNYPQIIPPPGKDYEFSVLIYDLNWLRFPGNFREPEKIDRWCREWIERAVSVITISEVTRREVIDAYGRSPASVIAAPLAPFPPHTTVSPILDKTVLDRLGLKAGRFYLYPAAWGLHKGFTALTEALELAKGTDPAVVTCGEPLEKIETATSEIATLRKSLAGRWKRLVSEKRLVITSYLPDEDLEVLRRNCKAYILPSEYEGFGFPLVEAIYHYRPALVAPIPAHVEMLSRYPQYTLARLCELNSGKTFAQNLNDLPTECADAPIGWAEGIEKTWSWSHTAALISSSLSMQQR
jgi:glycosyltransferase involved in cell wall biosynthesis